MLGARVSRIVPAVCVGGADANDHRLSSDYSDQSIRHGWILHSRELLGNLIGRRAIDSFQRWPIRRGDTAELVCPATWHEYLSIQRLHRTGSLLVVQPYGRPGRESAYR